MAAAKVVSYFLFLTVGKISGMVARPNVLTLYQVFGFQQIQIAGEFQFSN
jgi:hypothetical protein